MTTDFRRYLFPHDHPRLTEIRGLDAYQYREFARKPGTFSGDLIAGWTPLYHNEFRGISEDGTVRPDLHRLAPAEASEIAPVAAMVDAARVLVEAVDAPSLARLRYAVDAVEWQTWANPEFMQFDTGLRLEFQPPEVRDAALDLMRASLSEEGFRLARDMMRINGWLGVVVDLPTILGEYSYNIALYGEPSLSEPWGWQLYGHHLAVNCLVVDGRMVISPLFLGAEPDRVDGALMRIDPPFSDRVDLAIAVMAALPQSQRVAATVFREMVDPEMPPGRVHPGDERHLAGAFQDNRVIPAEGIAVMEMPEPARELVWQLAERFLALLPDGPRAARIREVRAQAENTWFSWIGGHNPGDVFYFRIQSPVIIAELDHHCGVFLDYDTPQPFHIHTVLRTPHGNDYGRSYVNQWYAARRAHEEGAS